MFDPKFIRFGRTPTCDRQADRQRDRQTQTQAHSIYRDSVARKNSVKYFFKQRNTSRPCLRFAGGLMRTCIQESEIKVERGKADGRPMHCRARESEETTAQYNDATRKIVDIPGLRRLGLDKRHIILERCGGAGRLCCGLHIRRTVLFTA